LAYTGVVGAVVSTGALPFLWVTPSWPELAMMIGIGLIAAVGHYLIIRAYDHAPAPVLAPFGYAEIVMATVVGYVAFGDIPDRWTALGVVVLIASGLYISVRESARRNRPEA
jgi:drug/metabolite transporter (DMT)-like permease